MAGRLSSVESSVSVAESLTAKTAVADARVTTEAAAERIPVNQSALRGNPLGVIVENNAATGKASKELGESLLELGPKPFSEAQAAHIVPTLGHLNRSEEAVRGFVTAQVKMDTYLPGMRNHAINGFWERVGHAGTHTDAYYRGLGEEFKDVSSWEDAVDALDNMRFRIMLGEFR
jgi:hypothetical protein